MNAAVSYEFRVAFGDCDPSGKVFQPAYFRWFDFGTHQMMSSAGVGQREQQVKFGMIGAALVDVRCAFMHAVGFDERLTHQLHVAHWAARSFRVSHVFRRNGEVVAEGEEVRMCLVMDAQGVIRSIPIPEGFRSAIEALHRPS